ncbi:MAG: sulfotransferase [Hasllibacter sp.]
MSARVFNLGLPKSGTTTLAEALARAGLRVADWKIPLEGTNRRVFLARRLYRNWFERGDPLDGLGAYDAFTEVNVANDEHSLWPQTDAGLIEAIRAKHPEMRFVLSRRDPARLADSMRRWKGLGTRRLPRLAVPGLPAGFGTEPGALERWIEGHYAFCERMFAGADDFLTYEVGEDGAQAAIGAFLGIDLPWWGVANANPAEAPA